MKFKRFLKPDLRIKLLVIFLFLSLRNINSQTFVGLTAGLNYSKLSGEDLGLDVDFKPGYNLGLYFNTKISRFFFQQTAIYSSRGFKLNKDVVLGNKTIEIQAKVNINSFDFPLLFGYEFKDRIGIFGGLQFEQMYSCFYIAEAYSEGQPFLDFRTFEDIINVDKYNTNSFSVLGGVSYMVKKLHIVFRYVHGITPITYSHNKKDYNMLFQLCLNYDLFSWIESDGDISK